MSLITPLFRALLLCLAVLLCSPVRAVDWPTLADDARWKALLHINPGATLRDRNRSYVDDPAFFLAEHGKQNSGAELIASATALSEDGGEARCQFPARYRFLAEQLGWQDEAPFAHCDDYLEWREAVHASRAVLVFPASYLNSPSSMFGHTLLRLDQGEDSAVWLSWAVNFGAVATEQDNSLFYIYRGLAGGYPGRFTLVPYVKKIQEYSHLENRDMWEYTLDLDQQQIDWMIEHLWELRDINFDYYFFDENCSFRLLELVEVARPGSQLLDDLRLAEVPVKTVRALDQAGLISERVYRPSKAVELESIRQQLTGKQQRLVLALAADPDVASQPAFQAETQQSQARLLDSAYRYLRLTHRKGERDADVARRSFALLSLINQHGERHNLAPIAAVPPEQGHGTQLLAVAGGQREQDDFAELSYRFTYHDLLDNPHGFLRGAQIEGLGLTLRSTESQRARLEALQLVSIRSLAPRNAFARPLSWYVEGGLERTLVEKRRLTRYLQGGAGGSWLWGNWQPYVLASLRTENNSGYQPFIASGAGAEAGMLYQRGHWQWQASSVGHYFSNDEYRHRSRLAIHRALGRHHGLRALVEREGERGNGEHEFKVQWRWYID